MTIENTEGMTDTPAPDTVIEVENVSKVFTPVRRSVALRQEARAWLAQWLGRSKPSVEMEPFYALRDVSFTVRRGEGVGIIGHNGAGKTTLLRLLAGILHPTEGRVAVRGRFVSLIALGAGFNPLLTGRENIFLVAAIYGVFPDQIEPLLPQIIEFADIGRFIDVPLKDYSTGMAARLGFSVAIHIVPDIVLLDEILAVGDITFQRKCEQKLAEFREERRTMLLVSHNLKAVQQLCDRVIWLDHGQVLQQGTPDEVLPAYAEHFAAAAT